MNHTISLYLVLWPFLFVNFSANAQGCIHTELSRQFDYKINIIGARHTDTSFGITSRKNAEVILRIYTKHNKRLIQKIVLNTDVLPEDAYENCNNVRSYMTGQNKNKDAADNEYGDFVVVALNFDGKEDLAVKYDSGGNAGPIYIFYIQQYNMHFEKDTYLSGKMVFFPLNINSKSHTLIRHAHADAYGYYENAFTYNPKTKKWRKTEHAYIKA